MSVLSSLTIDDSITNEIDSVGGNTVIESGLYNCKITLAYINKADSGAMGLVLNLKTEGGRDVRQTLWMTSGTAKGGKNYYEKDGEKRYLPGFIHADALCLLTVGKNISAMETETKVVNVYSGAAKAEVPTKVDMLMDLMDQEVLIGLIKQVVDKTKKNDAGDYEPTGETREENEIDKVFRAKDRMTTAEIRAQAETAVFVNSWDAKWTGKVKDRAKGAASGVAGTPKSGGAASGTKKPTTSLFG